MSIRLLHIDHELKVLYKLVDGKPIKVVEICKGYILTNGSIDTDTKFFYFSNIKDVNVLSEAPLDLVEKITKQLKIQE